MNNLLSYCGLVDARISASEFFLPVMGSIMGQFPLRNGVLLMITILVNPVVQWRKIMIAILWSVGYFVVDALQMFLWSKHLQSAETN